MLPLVAVVVTVAVQLRRSECLPRRRWIHAQTVLRGRARVVVVVVIIVVVVEAAAPFPNPRCSSRRTVPAGVRGPFNRVRVECIRRSDHSVLARRSVSIISTES